MSFRITWKTHIVSLIVAIVIIAVLNNQVNVIINDFFEYIVNYASRSIILAYLACILILTIPVLLLHELCHGLSYIIFGGRVRFGFKGIYAYTQEVSGKSFSRTEFLIILLSPTFLISIISLFLPGIGGMIFLINLIGSSGDVYMALYLSRCMYECRVVDRDYGFEIL